MADLISMLAAAAGAAAGGGEVDPNFNQTVLLLHGDGTNGAQNNTFVDSSTNNFTITRGGNATQGSFSPFGRTSGNLDAAYDPAVNGGSGYFDGTGDYIAAPNNAAFNQTADFSIDCWVYITGNPANGNYQYFGAADGNPYFQIGLDASGYFVLVKGYVGTLLSSNGQAGVASANQWYHVCISRESGTCRLFVDGVLQASTTDAASTTIVGAYSIGGLGASLPFTGYIANFRFVRGGVPSLVSTASTTAGATIFTPPTTPLTGSESLTAGSVSLLCNFTNAGIFDNTGKNNLETRADTQIDTSIKKYGTGSIQFDGTGDQLYIANSPELAMGTGDFTCEMWYYENTGASGNKGLFDTRTVGGATNGFLLQRIDTKNLRVFTNASVVTTGADTIVQGTWQHIAVVRQSGTIRIYLDGVEKDNAANTQNFTNTDCWIGDNADNAQKLNGYLDDIRVTKGVCRYPDGTTFTPPTQAFPNI